MKTKLFTLIFLSLLTFSSISQVTLSSVDLSGASIPTVGSNLIIPINVANVPDFYTLTAVIEYDQSVLEYVGYQDAAVTMGSINISTNQISVEFGVFSFPPVALELEDGLAVNLIFKYRGGNSSFDFIVNNTDPAVASNYLDVNVIQSPISNVTNGSITGGTVANTISSGTWTSDGSWSLTVSPNAFHNVIIASGDAVSLSAASSVNSVTIQSGGKLNQTAGTLTTTGDFLIEDGGSFIQEGSLSVGGTTQVSKTVGAHATEGWKFMAAPVSDQAIDPAFTGTSGQYDFFRYDEPNQTWYAFAGANWGANTNFEAGKAYLTGYAAGGTKTFAGALNTANVSVDLTNTAAGDADLQGFNLIGNPFPSALTWNASTWGGTNVQATAYAWNNGSYVPVAANDVLQPTEGIFVYTSASETLSIPAASRVHPTSAPSKSSVVRMSLTAKEQGSEIEQLAIVEFNPSASANYDLAYDAKFLAGNAPQFYSIAGNERLLVNSLPALNEELVIPFDFQVTQSGNYEIELHEVAGSLPVYLTDRKTNTQVELSAVGSYYFTAEMGDDTDRFLIHFAEILSNEMPNLNQPSAYAYSNTLVINDANNNLQVSVYNALGQHVSSFATSGMGVSQHELNVPTGSYMIRMQSNNQVVTSKVFIQ